MKPLILGTRGSDLARWQAEFVAEALTSAHPDVKVELKIIRTAGDRKPEAPTLGEGTGFFTREIEAELLSGEIDLAVHSLKDLPTELPEGLAFGAILAREDPADVLISKSGLPLEQLPAKSRVLTGAPRRQAQALHRRPDLRCAPVRGNVPTRLRKLEESNAEALILARAGLLRLKLADAITQRLDPEAFVPAVGQGALAVEVRLEDERVIDLCEALDDPATRLATAAERAFLAALEGGCRVPAGAYARFTPGGRTMRITGMAATADGLTLLKRTIEGPAGGIREALLLGARLAEELRAAGAEEILREIRRRPISTQEGME